MTPNRRQFLLGCASLPLAIPVTLRAAADDLPKDVRITRIIGFELPCRRKKIVGKNAQKDVHGDQTTEPAVRIYTNADGVEGLGFCNVPKERLAELIGKRPLDLLHPDKRRLRSPLGAQTMPMWDLLARAAKMPAWGAFADPVHASTDAPRIRVYDGSIYLADLLPDFANGWEDQFKREIDMGLEMGHRGFKIKIGRGKKWMPRAEGDARDVAVVKLIRQHAGKDVMLGVDANNGYDLDGAKRFIDDIGDAANLAFAEEMFPETVEQCLAFKEHFRVRKLDTLLADGESQGDLNVFKPFIAAKAIDVLQADMNRFGADGILDEADMARPAGIRVAPHNWGSLLGYYHQLHVGAATPGDTFYAAEHDPLESDLLVAEGFTRKDGFATLPSTSGFGLRIDERRFAESAKVRFDLKA